MTDVNVALLRKTLEWAYGEYQKALRGEVSEWYQGEWMVPTVEMHSDRDIVDLAVREGTACGTTCCIAGKVAYDAGWRLVAGSTLSPTLVRNGVLSSPLELGAELLGLSTAEATELFYGGNSIFDLYRIAGEITEGEIEPPPGLRSVR